MRELGEKRNERLRKLLVGTYSDENLQKIASILLDLAKDKEDRLSEYNERKRSEFADLGIFIMQSKRFMNWVMQRLIGFILLPLKKSSYFCLLLF